MVSLAAFYFAFHLLISSLSEAAEQTCARTPMACTGNPDLVASVQEITCQTELAKNSCDDFAKTKPELASAGKLKSCDFLAACKPVASTGDFLKACAAEGATAWKDFAKALANFLFSDSSDLPSEIRARERYFANCTTIQCKREMLGPFSSLFSKEEIEGSGITSANDANDLAAQNRIHGFSAPVLYRQMLLRLKKMATDKSGPSPYIDPWSGKPAQLPRNIAELIDDVMTEAGLSHTACIDPIALTEMRCYAFFSVVANPVNVAAAGASVAKFFKIRAARKVAEAELIAKSRLMSADERRQIIDNKLGIKTRFSARPAENITPQRFTLETSDGKEVGYLTYIDPNSQPNHLSINSMGVTEEFQRNGVSEVLIAEFIERNPKVSHIHAALGDTNDDLFQKAMRQGKSCLEAIKTTALYKAQVKNGFGKIVGDPYCGGTATNTTYVVTRD